MGGELNYGGTVLHIHYSPLDSVVELYPTTTLRRRLLRVLNGLGTVTHGSIVVSQPPLLRILTDRVVYPRVMVAVVAASAAAGDAGT